MTRGVLMIFALIALALLAESAWAFALGEHAFALMLTGSEIAFCAAVLLVSLLRRAS
jgi:hypothetical protein